MKITSVELIKCRELACSRQIPVLCRIHTDAGIYGYGEAGVSIAHFTLGSYELLKLYARAVIGMDPLENDVIYSKLMHMFWSQGSGGVLLSAVSAIDTALWDIKGKALGQPLYKLLGGKHRDKLRCYASQLQAGWRNEDFFAVSEDLGFLRDSCLRAVAEGYDAVKVDVMGMNIDGQGNATMKGHITPRIMRRIEERLRTVRDAVGPDTDVILEMHNTTSVNTAIEFARMAEPYGIMFLEEPCIALNADCYRRLADNISIPLATGERTYLREGYLPLLTNGSLAVIQPDLGNCGGVTEGRKICDLAEIYGVQVQTHTCNTPISVAVSLHLEAAIPNFVIHEHHTTNTLEPVRALCVHDYQPENGYFAIPELPGIGNELTEEALRQAQIETVR